MNTKLFESYNKHLNESNREELLSNIRHIKSLLNKDMNDENYKDKSDQQLEIILNKYKDEYNKANITNYVVQILLYNNETTSGIFGYLDNNNNVVTKYKDALIFKTRNEAQEVINNYNPPDGYIIVKIKPYKIKY